MKQDQIDILIAVLPDHIAVLKPDEDGKRYLVNDDGDQLLLLSGSDDLTASWVIRWLLERERTIGYERGTRFAQLAMRDALGMNDCTDPIGERIERLEDLVERIRVHSGTPYQR